MPAQACNMGFQVKVKFTVNFHPCMWTASLFIVVSNH